MPDTSRPNPSASPLQNPRSTSRFLPGDPSDAANPLVSEHDRGALPKGLLTRRQLRAKGLSPGGHDPVAVLRCTYCALRPDQSCNHPTRGWLYDVSLARPKRVPTLAQEWALDRAMAARQTCVNDGDIRLCRRSCDVAGLSWAVSGCAIQGCWGGCCRICPVLSSSRSSERVGVSQFARGARPCRSGARGAGCRLGGCMDATSAGLPMPLWAGLRS
ncbi:RRQRL motif-containing zinc-binding protein [Streptomyces sp. 5.8]|uniref:RRQRL motif-containing zinc-binding protein n=1 Tax=Streptomyces sp. 5.8 TaxID=3406571 RepID=UPI003BB6A587